MPTDPHSTHDLVLEILGTFARVQSLIDEVLARNFFRSRVPATCDLLYSLAIDRIRDSDRPRLVAKITEDLGENGNIDVGVFSSTYASVKQVRDAIGHAVKIEPQGNGSVNVPGFGPIKKFDLHILPAEQLTSTALSSHWLAAVVNYLIFSMYDLPFPVGANKLAYPKPPCRLPKDWRGGDRCEMIEHPKPFG